MKWVISLMAAATCIGDEPRIALYPITKSAEPGREITWLLFTPTNSVGLAQWNVLLPGKQSAITGALETLSRVVPIRAAVTEHGTFTAVAWLSGDSGVSDMTHSDPVAVTAPSFPIWVGSVFATLTGAVIAFCAYGIKGAAVSFTCRRDTIKAIQILIDDIEKTPAGQTIQLPSWLAKPDTPNLWRVFAKGRLKVVRDELITLAALIGPGFDKQASIRQLNSLARELKTLRALLLG